MLLQSKRVWIGGQFIEAQIEIEDSKIINIYPYNTKQEATDYGNNRIVPGFIDVHAHGAYGFDTNEAYAEGLERWLKRLPEEGVTGVLPTTVTQSKEVLSKALENVAEVYKKKPAGAQILGVHFEGPYLDFENKGAQPEQFIVKPDLEEFKHYQNKAEGLIKYITMATEHDVDHKLTQYASQNGVVVAIGHSGATYQQAVMGIANGANSFTHAFNGMTSLHHRNPNMVGAMMRSNDVFAEIIGDGRHVNPVVVNSLFKTKPHNMLLITDSLMLKGMPVGDYELGGSKIIVDEYGTAFIKGTNTLSGSTLKVNFGLRNLVDDFLVPFDQALNAATLNPARVLRIDDHKGKIVVDYDADLVVLKDNYEVIQTYSLGKACL